MDEVKNDEVVDTTIKNEAAPAPKADEKKEPAKKKATPRIFFKEDSRVCVTINGYHSNETGDLSFVVAEEDEKESVLNDNADTIKAMFTKVPYKFWFTRCSYDKLNRYRSRSMIYNQEDQNNTVNEPRLREFLLVFHLVDWDLKDEDGNKIELTFDPNKVLSDNSLKIVYSLPAILIDAALVSYEKKMSILVG